RELEATLGRRRAHLRFEVTLELGVLPLEKEDHVLDVLEVSLPADQPHARSRAAPELVFHAGSRTPAKEAVRAIAKREDLLDDPEHLAHGARRAVRAEVEVAVLLVATDHPQPRPGLREGDLDADVGLVVLQPDVVDRPMLLDEVVLEDESLGLGLGDQAVDVANPIDKETHEHARVGALSEIGADSAAKVDR